MPIGDLLAQISGEPPGPRATSAIVAPSLKRKADNDLPGNTDKVSRNSLTPAIIPRLATPVQKPSDSAPSMPKSSRPRPGISSTPKAPLPKSSSAQPVLESPKVNPVKPPKKGSFAEIMARAKAAQTNMAQVGKIQHKRIEKAPSKREREEIKAAAKSTGGKAKSKGSTGPLRDGRNGARENGRGSRTTSVEAEKKPKKAAVATTGYTGTARPNPATARKLHGKSSNPSSHTRDRPSPGPSGHRYTYAASDGDEEDDYDSDASSDMEAAVFEVDEEEEIAARFARKEDALALAEENRLKKEKEEKRRRLAALAKNKR